jgi:hypothetical protein
MDFKGEFKNGLGYCYPFTLIDDHSRFSLGIKALDNQRATSVQAQLIRVFREYGKPSAILTDHGVQWFSTSSEHGLTQLSVFILKQDIELIYSGFRHPQTQGKIERYNRTLKDYIKFHGPPSGIANWQRIFNQFVEEYNYIRPHHALNMDTPVSRYQTSDREYVENAKEWEYPSGSMISRVDKNGCISHKGHRHFISEALIKERVQVQEFDTDQILVSFRDRLIRQIDRKTGNTNALVFPAI